MHCCKSQHIQIFHYKSTVLTEETHCCIISKWELQAFSQHSGLIISRGPETSKISPKNNKMHFAHYKAYK
uniref:Uncharacterized protein n=1 Tax=Anguilla anguilla TaxID=7936 RepID=A0A0E9SS72_ANGAN